MGPTGASYCMAAASYDARTGKRVEEILKTHQPEPLPKEVIAELDEMEKRWMRDLERT